MPTTAKITALVLAVTLSMIQTTPYIISERMIEMHGLMAVLLATMLLGLLSKTVFMSPTLLRQLYCRDAVTTKKPTILFVFFVCVSAVQWLTLFYALSTIGATQTIMATLLTGISAVFVGNAILLVDHHRIDNGASKSMVLVLMLVASMLIAKHQIASLDIEESRQLLIAVGALVLFGTIKEVLRPLLTDVEEARLRMRAAYSIDTVQIGEIGGATLIILVINILQDGGSAAIALMPDSIDPKAWDNSHYSLLWIGVLNTALGMGAEARLTNSIGLPTMKAISQTRPMMSEILQVGLGAISFSIIASIDIVAATTLLIIAGFYMTGLISSNRPLGNAA